MNDSIAQNGLDGQAIWAQALVILEPKMTKGSFGKNIKPLQVVHVEKGKLVLKCAPMSLEWLENQLKGQVLATVRGVDEGIVDVSFVADEPPVTSSDPPSLPNSNGVK